MIKTQHTYDELLEVKSAVAVTASGAWPTILDLGAGEVRGDLIFDISTLKISANNEVYAINVQGAADTATHFTDATNIIDLMTISLGPSQTKTTDSDRDDNVGKYVFPFSNVRNGVVCRYVRIYYVVAGTAPNITDRVYFGKRSG